MSEEIIETAGLGDKIVGVLKTIFDPEIPVDIYELGLIYDVLVNEDADVKILMTLTTPNCPVAETLPREVEEKVKTLQEIIVGLQSENNISVILCDHQARDLLACVDTAAIIHNGKVVAQGTPTSLIQNIDARNAYFGESFKIS